MKFRLKNKDLQVQLDALSGGDFSRRIDELMTGEPVNLWANMCGAKTVQITFGETREFSVRIPVDDIEEILKYDTHKWNSYPDVEPPEGVLMRVECKNGMKACAKWRIFVEGGSWCDVNGGAWPEAYSQSVARFRPWEDEE